MLQRLEPKSLTLKMPLTDDEHGEESALECGYEKITITTPEETILIIAPPLEPEVSEPIVIDPESSRVNAPICAFCGQATEQLHQSELYRISCCPTKLKSFLTPEIFSMPKTKPLPSGIHKVSICRQCAEIALHELLDPNDPEVIAETKQIEEEIDFQVRRARDLDKIIMTGGLRVFRICEQDKMLKEYTRANSTNAEGVDITWGSWKTFEKFKTKKALYERVKELEQEPNVIFDGR
jgi:hypothetical protein